MEDKSVIFVLGMHRSGTSCLTKHFRAIGVNLGPYPLLSVLLEPIPFYSLNESILNASGGSWHTPPVQIKINDDHKKSMKQFASVFCKTGRVLKDPRLVLLADEWMKFISPVKMFGTFRHPSAVAKSLTVRDNWSHEKGIEMWKEYNDRLVVLHKRYKFPIIEFDLKNTDEYKKKFINGLRQLGLNNVNEQLNNVAIQTEDHNNSSNDPVPMQCKEIWDYLKSVSLAL